MSGVATVALALLLFALLCSRSLAQGDNGGEGLDVNPAGSGSAMEVPATTPSMDGVSSDKTSRTVLTYLSVFPCTAADFRDARRSKKDAIRLLRTCDVFTFIASELAALHINQNRQEIFTYPDTLSLSDNTYTLHQLAVKGTKVIYHILSYIFHAVHSYIH